MGTLYSTILEVPGDAEGRDAERLADAIVYLRHSAFGGRPVRAVVGKGDDSVNVPHFAYGYRCNDGCEHERPAAGVMRHFGFSIVLDGEPDTGIFGTYALPPTQAEIAIVGATLHDLASTERKRLPASK
jgi:hypothetical protein